MPKKTPAPAPVEAVPYPEFGKIVTERLDRIGLSNAEAAKPVGCTPEMIRRYREGKQMPRDAKLERLAKMLGLTPSQLRYPTRLAGKMPLSKLDPDEAEMLAEYQKLPPFAKKIVRSRIVELLEEFGAPDKTNPFAKGTQ